MKARTILIAVAATLALPACSSSAPAAPAPAPVTVTATATTTTTMTATVTAAAPAPVNTGIKDGTYLVGSEIALGIYQSNGDRTTHCYAETKDKAGNALEMEMGGAGESVIIRIMSGAYTFRSVDCHTWKKVG